MTLRRLIGAGVLIAGLVTATSGTPLSAQHPVERMEWMMNTLRPSGQPVVPIFDGWYQKPDGTYDLCFGYFSLNTEEVLDIPLGPDNFIEPARFDGNQPTHFMPVPAPPNLYRRYFCVFTVNVPSDFGRRERVVWQLRVRGETYAVPGHLAAPNYALEEIHAESRGSVAPVIRFEPDGPEGRGRSGVRAEPLRVAVGDPKPLSLSVISPEGTPATRGSSPSGEPRRLWWVAWAKHQGPGDVTFSQQEIDVYPGEETVTTTAMFSEPGNYVLRVQAIDNPGENGSYQFHCCWTNGYVDITVTP